VTVVNERSDTAADAVQRAFDRAAGTHSIAGNEVALLIDGPDTFAAMLAQIAGARRRVHLENYIIRDDATGQRFAQQLAERARAGVAVRVLYDWFGSIGTAASFWRELRAAGVEVCAFGPPRLRDPLVFLSRDHRKVLVVDGERGVVGGLCLGDEWMGNPAKGRQPWRDTAVALSGPAARILDGMFCRAWTFAGGADPDAAELAPAVEPAGDVAVRIVATEPGRERAYRMVDLLIGMSGSRIWLTEAYLVTPQRMFQALQDAARDGADVRLLLPGTSDVRVLRNFARVGYRALLRAGVRIWEWRGPMLHAKTIVADSRWVSVGSSNLNPSSLLANWELDIFVAGEPLAQAMEARYVADVEQSSEVLLRPRWIPSVFGRPVPPALTRSRPPAPATSTEMSFQERRRRAIVLLSGVLFGARAALFGPFAIGLLAVGVLFAVFPVPMAWLAAGVAALASASLASRAVGHRRRG
jgi:cardiolipin synthase